MNSLARTLQLKSRRIRNPFGSAYERPEASKDDLAVEMGGYELVRAFERRTDRRTVVVTAVSAKRMDDKVMFRVATFREHLGKDGVLRRSPWLGQREVVHKLELEQEAMGYIVAETARLRQPSLTFSA
jgi:hypothetical protein